MDPLMWRAEKDGEKLSCQEELWHLIGIRDFISLLLTYPIKLEEEGILKAWINAFKTQWRPKLLTTNDVNMTDKPWHVLTGKTLKCMEGFMPMEIISQIEHSGRPIFYHHNDVPRAILDLTVDLAVEQLIQTLFSRDDCARYVRLTTRDSVEKSCVVNKITAALEEDKHNCLFGINKGFLRALWIDASVHESDAEVRVQQQINAMMAQDVEEEMKSNRYLVILLDRDGNKRLDPTKVHFPVGTVVLITTETELSAQAREGDDEFAITRTMDLNITTQDHLLSWELFCSYMVNNMAHLSRGIQSIAEQIVKECHGHLLAIVLVAKFLKNVWDVKQWELALEKLRFTNPSYDYQESDRRGISRAMVNAFLNIICEGMEKTQKLCLELSLFVHNIKTGVPLETLMSNWVGVELSHKHEVAQRLFPFDYGDIRLNYTMEEACYDINVLIGRSILFESGSGYVRLPIETYDIIESIHKLNPSIIRGGALGLIEPPHIGRWHGLIRIELMDNEIYELPQSPDCPNLKVLLLQRNADLMDIPVSFFDRMPLLQYLDLSYTSIRDLPPSISKLKELEKFFLRGCDLFMELPPEIGHLKNLEELDLDRTLITQLPEEIRELINLKNLILCFEGYYHALGHGNEGKKISNSTIIPPGVISNLTQLNYLSIHVDPDDKRWNEDVFNILMEILGLERLKRVSIYVPKVEFLEVIPSHTSLDFRLIVGHHMRRFISRVTPQVEEKFKHCDHSIKFVNGVNVPNGVKMNLSRSRALYLDRHMTIKSLSEFQLKNLYMLRVCILAECNEMETIVDGSYSDDECDLPNLEFLSVFYMKKLRSIHQGTPPPRLQCLKTIALHTCPMLTTIFTLSLLCNLSLLEELIIEDCPKVTTLISHDSSEHETPIYLPSLKKITLAYLPELVSIFNGLHVENGLRKMGFYYCPKLQSLSKSELSSKYLRVIKGESKWWEALKWNEAEWGCANRPHFLKRIFSPINEEVDIMTQLTAYHDDDQVLPSIWKLGTVNWNEAAGELSHSQPSSGVTFQMTESPSLSFHEESGRDLRDEKQIVSRKNTNTLPEWTEHIRVSPTGMGMEVPPDDVYSWRKYGQKDILGSKYPRGYYRCTHRYQDGCLAKKRVQISDEDPTILKITYQGKHTCKVVLPTSSQQEEEQESILKTHSQQQEKKNVLQRLEEQPNDQPLNLWAGLKLQTENLDSPD